MCAGEKNILEKTNISCVGLLHWKWKYDIWSDLRHCISCKEKQNLYTYLLIVLYHDKSFLSFHWNVKGGKTTFLVVSLLQWKWQSFLKSQIDVTVLFLFQIRNTECFLEVISNHYCPKFVVLSYLKKKKKKKKNLFVIFFKN